MAILILDFIAQTRGAVMTKKMSGGFFQNWKKYLRSLPGCQIQDQMDNEHVSSVKMNNYASTKKELRFKEELESI